MLAVAKLDSSQPATPENMTVSIHVNEFISEFDLRAKSTYGDVRATAEHLMDRYIRFFDTNKKGNQIEVRVQWIGRATYEEDAGTVELVFWHELSPMLFELKSHFTSYKLSRAGGLRSVYSWRLFELLMQFKTTGYLKISLEEFSNILDAPKSARNKFSNMRNRVIEPAVKEIREKDGLNLRWSPVKINRKITSLEFNFPVEPQKKLSFPSIDQSYIEKHAYPGESYEQARKRLQEEHKKQK